MKERKLSRLEDYVFLSALDRDEFFLVQRDGHVWKQNGDEAGTPVGRDFSRAFYNWKTFIGDKSKWSWVKGWMPVLQIENDSGKRIQMLVKGDSLWIRDDLSVVSHPEGGRISNEHFEDEMCLLEKYWTDWFKSGWYPPRLNSRMDDAWRSSWIQARSAYSGKHPHYGVGYYGKCQHDGFPPTTCAMVSTLLEYGHVHLAQDIFSYYLDRFLMPDGHVDYYGVSLAELGMVLILGAGMLDYSGGEDWLRENLRPLAALFRQLTRCRNPVMSRQEQGLMFGVPEADQRHDAGVFFHNNAFVWRAFQAWAAAMSRLGHLEVAVEAGRHARELKTAMDMALHSAKRNNGMVPSRIDKEEKFKNFAESREAAYVNYRYYPELLEANILSADDAAKIIVARETLEGEVHGMTCFGYPGDECRFDNWTLASYARGLLELGDRTRFINVFANHGFHHQTQDTFTTYEQVSKDGCPRRAFADWCVPCQLVLPRLLAWSFKYVTWDGRTISWDGKGIVG
ncbi:MAG: hypothetical protein PHV34_07180 [Verrucomicrobiae bacterium]|nr:hypothetical protein [Verrucomicrobiae bacterium]